MLTVPKTFKSMLINSHHSDSYNDKMQLNLKKQKSDVSKVAKLDKFADSQVEKLIRDAGAFRVSGAAITRFNDILTQKCLTVARYAVEIARHGGRKTVKASDVKLASER